MGSSVVRQTQARQIKRFLGTGLELVKEEVPSNYTEDPCYCPYFLNEACEGAKDSEYKGRCESETFAYLNCRLYADFEEQKKEIPERKVSDPLSDTVIMSAEDIVGSRPKKHRTHHHIDDSIHDRVADGESDRKFGYFRRRIGSVEW